jgi:hypothetical protein
MKVGDIVYFKSVYIAKYTSGEYHFKPGDRYRIDDIRNVDVYNVRTGNITNLEDGTNHFAHSSHWDKIITIEEWREIQLNKILNENYTPW